MHTYEIRVQGQLDQHWSEWSSGLTISYAASGNTVLRGPLADGAALHGVLSKVRDLALPRLPVNRVGESGPDPSSPWHPLSRTACGPDGPSHGITWPGPRFRCDVLQ